MGADQQQRRARSTQREAIQRQASSSWGATAIGVRARRAGVWGAGTAATLGEPAVTRLDLGLVIRHSSHY